MNIPNTKLDKTQTIMIVGMGGGFDVFTGLPFVYHWKDKNFVLVNNSPSNEFHFRESTQEDYPQGLIEPRSNIIGNYSIGRHGTILFKKAYEHIVKTHQIDAILAVDGGVDSLQTGNEDSAGTILEDFITIAALDDIKIDKILCCAGFGTETEENLNHYRVLENMAALAAHQAFLGSFSLTQNMKEFTEYLIECESVWLDRRKSHIQTKIISAVLGQFGANNKYTDIDAKVFESTDVTFISLLTSIFWMFDFNQVASNNITLNSLKKGNTFADCKILLREYVMNTKRSKLALPL